MKTVPVSELTSPALDWAVAKCEGVPVETGIGQLYCWTWGAEGRIPYCPSSDWSIAGPIIERERVQMTPCDDMGSWEACMMWGRGCDDYVGSTALTAAMRCYVDSKLGDTVEIPDELL